ncbi:MAG TPA: hypothetical protein VGN72_04340 [Tepidisphaeraceae bacterium]|jgi:hypothetical protein|nr:hypothetical protein [Tepidisphaeraceae bacterium]
MDASDRAPILTAAQTLLLSNVEPARYDINVSTEDTLRGRFIRELIDGGHFASLTGSELAGLVAMTRWIDAAQVTPDYMLIKVSVGKLREITQLGKSIAHTSLKSLASKGIIQKVVEGTGHVTSIYALPLLRPDDGPPPASLREGTAGAVPRARASGTPGTSGARPGVAGAALGARATNGRSTAPADTSGGDTLFNYASANAEAFACVPLLLAQGFEEGEAQSLADHPNCSVKQIGIAVTRCDWLEANGKLKSTRQAFIATAIRKKFSAPMTAEDRRQTSKPEHVQEDLAIERQRRVAAETKKSREEEALRSLPRADFDALVKEVLAIADPVLRQGLENIRKATGPLGSPLWHSMLHGQAVKRGLLQALEQAPAGDR